MQELNLKIKFLLDDYVNGKIENDFAIQEFEKVIEEFKAKKSNQKLIDAKVLDQLRTKVVLLIRNNELVKNLKKEFDQNKIENSIIKCDLGLLY